MSDRFIGPGGNNGNDGLTWANRWLDFTNVTAANFPSNANRRCLVGPGTYYFAAQKAMPTASSGFLHEYVADYSGALTDGVGGPVRLTNRNTNNIDYAFTTGSLMDWATGPNFVTVRGFIFDTYADVLTGAGGTTSDWIVEDCVFTGTGLNFNLAGLNSSAGTSITNRIVRRCLFIGKHRARTRIASTGTGTSTGNVIENVLGFQERIITLSTNGYLINAVTNVTAGGTGYSISFAVSGQTGTVKNSYLVGQGITANATNSITEDYNVFAQGSSTARQNVTAGANSLAGAVQWRYHAWFPLSSGIISTMRHLRLQLFSPSHSITPDTDMPTEDLFGLKRPTALSKRTPGAIQRQPVQRVATPTFAGSYSLRFSDAGRYQVMVPYNGGSVTVAVRVQRQADYSGANLPGMVIKQPYQADITVADAGGTGTWNEINHTFTPASLPKWFIVELFSDNEATSGNYNVYFDAFTVT